ncbi:MAG TPA: phosphatase PAP2 family protein [bacterium]|jgi:membrane-associated phospholipid phosphatase
MRVVFALVVLVVVPRFAFAQSFKSEAHTAWHVTGDMVRAPLHASTGDYLMAAGLLSGIVLSTTLDRPVHTAVRKLNDPWVKTVDDIGHAYQSPFVIFGTAGALYAYGALESRPGVRRVGWEIMESYAIAGAGTQIVKHVVGRHRPYENDGPFSFSGPSVKNGHQSFPSGDVTVAFSFASVLAAEVHTVPTTILFYGLGALTAFQRMNRNQHWFSDTIAGAAWGTAVGLGVVHYNRLRASSPVKISASAQPMIIAFSVDL